MSARPPSRSGNLSAWSIRHPVGIAMLTLGCLLLGGFALQRLGVNLLPQIIAPEVLVRIRDAGVPASIMEDRVTRQLEEQLAITENAIAIRSRTTEGRSAVDLRFPYGTDIDAALRDASIRLDRAKRFLPASDEPPVIYKRDPSQIPVVEVVVGSNEMDAIELRSWVDYTLSKWFLNLPGVAAVEVGGGLQREIRVIPDQDKLASLDLDLPALAEQIRRQNHDAPGGRMQLDRQHISTRSAGRFTALEELRQMPLNSLQNTDGDTSVTLGDVSRVIDTYQEERLRIRLNKIPGVKMSIQKQPQANTVAVADEIRHRLAFLEQQRVIPEAVDVAVVGDQSTFVRHAIGNAALAAGSGALLAMTVIYLFLGSLRRTLVIGSAIPIGMMVTFILMQWLDLSLNIMTLGGLALGMGLLIDSTIVMLENITRHQQGDNHRHPDRYEERHEILRRQAQQAATEVNSPIVASTSTNLAALLPFLFIGGLSGLLFRELIFTISAAMIASLIVALTLVPAFGCRLSGSRKPAAVTAVTGRLLQAVQRLFERLGSLSLAHPYLTLLAFLLPLIFAGQHFFNLRSIYLPNVDEGRVSLSITGDSGMQLDEMDRTVEKIEDILLADPQVETLFTTAGGFVFGRTEYQSSNRSAIRIQLVPRHQRRFDSEAWVASLRKKIDRLQLTGFRIHARVNSVRGIRTSDNDDDISLHIRGVDLEVLRQLANQAIQRLEALPGLSNLNQSYDEIREELKVTIDRQRAIDYRIDTGQIGQALRIALDGEVISDFIENDRNIDIRLQLPESNRTGIDTLRHLLVGIHDGEPVRLGDVARIERSATAERIVRFQQQRIVEISATYRRDVDREQVLQQALDALSGLDLPEGYVLYDNDSNQTLQQDRQHSQWLLSLAIFLVLIVMAVQYESLKNPFVILLSIPFALIGVALGFYINPAMPVSMPVWLGLIMLTGIVVNNAIVLVEQIEIERRHRDLPDAIRQATRIRLRPILMTTLTTAFGMLPLALGWGEGAEMLQPLAFVIVWGLGFSMLVSLVLVPVIYRLLQQKNA